MSRILCQSNDADDADADAGDDARTTMLVTKKQHLRRSVYMSFLKHSTNLRTQLYFLGQPRQQFFVRQSGEVVIATYSHPIDTGR